MPQGLIRPPLTAAEPAPAEWKAAGFVDPMPAGGAMQRAETMLRRLYFGVNEADLFLRLESSQDFGARPVSIYISCMNGAKSNHRPRGYETNPALELPAVGLDWEIRLSETEATLYRSEGQEVWSQAQSLTRLARSPRVREVAVSYRAVGLDVGRPS